MNRYDIKPEGLGEINIDLSDDGEWVRFDDIEHLFVDAQKTAQNSEQIKCASALNTGFIHKDKSMEIEFNKFSKIARYSREVIVTEKIDGTNAQIYIGDDGQFLVGSRKRWITLESDNFGFCKWVDENKKELLELGSGRHYGEWWGSGIQRGYSLTDGERRFSLFNVERWSIDRPSCCHVVPVLWRGKFDDIDIKTIMLTLKDSGSIAAKGYDNPEGIVIYHTQGNVSFKKTFKKDDTGKWDK